MHTYRAELHVHTVLSPCAEVEMIPPLIVAEALEQGINLIAITDHNASANVSAVQKAAAGTGITVLPGMELQTQEEVHILCLFDRLDQLADWQDQVDLRMPEKENNPEYFGEQFVVDETGDFIRREKQLLLTSAGMSLESAIASVIRLGGIAIPAHVNRQAFGLITNLGWVPDGVPVAALEISRHMTIAEARRTIPMVQGYPLIRSGDVHRLDEFLGANLFQMEAPTLAELKLALQHEQDRCCIVE